MRKLFISLLFVIAMFGLGTSILQAGELDILVDKLVEKGILTPLEAQIIVDETKQSVAEEVAKGKSYAVPTWVQKIKLKGDVRLRYQWQDDRDNTREERHRGRVRFRLGLTSKITDQWEIGAGLATGGDDPRSTNQTFDDTFDSPDIRLDYAYAKYSPWDFIDIWGGKFKRKKVLWEPTDLYWDGDINPEGISIVINHQFDHFENINFMFNIGGWVLDEGSSDTSDPVMGYIQPGFIWDIENGWKFKNAVTVYGFNSVKGETLDNSAGTNTNASAALRSDYTTIVYSAELSVKDPFEPINYAALFFEIGENLDDDDPTVDETGSYVIGGKIGDKKVKKPGQWQAKYQYKRMERDAWIDAFPDSDAYDGDTNVRGHEVVFKYAVANNVVLGLDYYHFEVIDGADDTENLLQADAVIKF